MENGRNQKSRPVGWVEVQLKDTEKVVLVDSGFSSTTDSLRMVGGGWWLGFGGQISLHGGSWRVSKV